MLRKLQQISSCCVFFVTGGKYFESNTGWDQKTPDRQQ